MKELIRRVRIWLAGLTFRTGVIVACVCVVCYAMSFLQDASSAIGDCERGALDHLLRSGEDCTIHCPRNTRHIGLSAAQTYLRKALTHALDEMWHFS